MSGGSFDYAYQRIAQFADDLGMRLDERNKVDEWGYKPNEIGDMAFSKLREIEEIARRVANLMKETEWLYSGDTSEDTFLERIEKIVSSNIEYNQHDLAASG